jgi:hypothetical protein
MERRREPRFAGSTPVTLRVLGETELTLNGEIIDASGEGLGLNVPQKIAPGTMMRIEVENVLLLGECCHCRAVGDKFQLGVILRHSLQGLAELEQQHRELVGEENSSGSRTRPTMVAS